MMRWALIMALRSPLVEVLAITVVAGNVDVEQGTQNALYTAELCAADVPVFKGAAAPLTRPLEDASWFHGRDGLGDHGYQPLTRKPAEGFAVGHHRAHRRSQSGHRDHYPRAAHQPGAGAAPGSSPSGARQPLRGHGRSPGLRRQRNPDRGIQFLGRPGSSPGGVALATPDRTGRLAAFPAVQRS